VVGLIAAVVPLSLRNDRAPAVPTAATVACMPGRTVVDSTRVTPLSGGTEITVVNRLHGSVVVEVGDQSAVIPPGTAEGQYPLAAGRVQVRCVADGHPSAPARLTVLSARGA
jgi:hypothetical protein